MRQTMNISLPPAMRKDVDAAVRTGEYASASEFFREILRAWKREKELQGLRESRKDARLGKVNVLRSLRDLR